MFPSKSEFYRWAEEYTQRTTKGPGPWGESWLTLWLKESGFPCAFVCCYKWKPGCFQDRLPSPRWAVYFHEVLAWHQGLTIAGEDLLQAIDAIPDDLDSLDETVYNSLLDMVKTEALRRREEWFDEQRDAAKERAAEAIAVEG